MADRPTERPSRERNGLQVSKRGQTGRKEGRKGAQLHCTPLGQGMGVRALQLQGATAIKSTL